MQTIQTKYLPATGTRGSRIKVQAEWGSKTYAYDHSAEDAHMAAFNQFLTERNAMMHEMYPDHGKPWWELVAFAGSLDRRGNVYIVK